MNQKADMNEKPSKNHEKARIKTSTRPPVREPRPCTSMIY